MNAIFKWFEPAPHLEEIQDQEEVKQLYQYWRVRILYSMFIGYAFYYFTRKSFTFAMPGLIAELGFQKSDLGLLGSVFAITYGFSKFAGGVIADRSNPRAFMAIGLIMTGVINIFFGLSSSILMFAIFWGLNGWFQGFGWPGCARFLTHWYSHSERGSWWSTASVSHNVGAFIIPYIVSLCLMYYDWRMAMYVPGVICIFGGLFLLNRLRDTPQSIGLPSIEKYRNDYQDQPSKHGETDSLTANQILVQYVLKNKFIWLLAIAYFFIYVVRQGINDWTALFLIESKKYNQLEANACVSLFEVGGFLGTLAAGWFSDYLFQAKRGPVNALFTLGMGFSTFLFWCVPAGYAWLDAASIFSIGFCTFGPQMLIGVAAAELSHKRAAATSVGFAGTFAYLGAAVAGWPLGKIIQEYEWDGFFLAIVVCCVVSLVLLIPMWSVTKKKSFVQAEPKLA